MRTDEVDDDDLEGEATCQTRAARGIRYLSDSLLALEPVACCHEHVPVDNRDRRQSERQPPDDAACHRSSISGASLTGVTAAAAAVVAERTGSSGH
jgi:hypothetical protein